MSDNLFPDLPDPAETTNGLCRVFQYSEDLWYSFDEAGRFYCKETWVKKMRPVPGVEVVALQLIPDPLFPMHGHETPYIAWQERLVKPRTTPRLFDKWYRVDTAPPPAACCVLAAYFDGECGEWAMDFTMSPPPQQYTHYMLVSPPGVK